MTLLAVPYDSGHVGTRMGRGPSELLGVLPERLAAAGHTVDVATIDSRSRFRTEINTAFELNRELATRVRAAAWKGALPVVLSGNCISCLGAVAGLGTPDLGVVWLDAHGDFNTPETSASGMLDGMALATLTGACWGPAAATIPRFAPVPGDRVVLLGARAFDPGECERLEAAGGTALSSAAVSAGQAEPALAQLRQRVARVYLHVDLDVLDPEDGRANGFATPGGLRLEETVHAVHLIAQRFRIVGVTLSAYDPAFDPARRVPAAAAHILLAALEQDPMREPEP